MSLNGSAAPEPTAVVPTSRHRPPWPSGLQANGSLGLGALAAIGLLIWVGVNGYKQTLLVTAATYALIALGMYIPFVLAGSLSLAYGAYASIGGYAVALISTETHLPLWFGWFIGPAIAAVAAVILGMATRRLSGFYLVAVTLLFSEAFQNYLSNASFTGGNAGLASFRNLDVFGWHPSGEQLIIACAALVCVTAFLLNRLRLSPWGIVVRSMREIPAAVEAAGTRVPVLNLVALAIGAGIGALGGALFTQMSGSIQPNTFTLNLVFLAIFMPIIGGTGTPWGAALGAVIVVELTLNLPSLHTSGTLLVSLGVLAIMLVAPSGVLGYLDTGRKQLTRALTPKKSSDG
jgi:branched-chain amino acid transport system permease protein